MALRWIEEVTIRPVSIDDAPAIITFKRKLDSETEYLAFNMEDHTQCIEQEKENIIKLTLASNSLYLGAFVENKIGGLLIFRGGKSPHNRHMGEFGIGVKKEFWGQGIGKKLISELFNWCKEAGIEKVMLKVRNDNARAISLYKKLGFKGETIKTGYVQGDSTPYEFLVMSKTFS